MKVKELLASRGIVYIIRDFYLFFLHLWWFVSVKETLVQSNGAR